MGLNMPSWSADKSSCSISIELQYTSYSVLDMCKNRLLDYRPWPSSRYQSKQRKCSTLEIVQALLSSSLICELTYVIRLQIHKPTLSTSWLVMRCWAKFVKLSRIPLQKSKKVRYPSMKALPLKMSNKVNMSPWNGQVCDTLRGPSDQAWNRKLMAKFVMH